LEAASETPSSDIEASPLDDEGSLAASMADCSSTYSGSRVAAASFSIDVATPPDPIVKNAADTKPATRSMLMIAFLPAQQRFSAFVTVLLSPNLRKNVRFRGGVAALSLIEVGPNARWRPSPGEPVDRPRSTWTPFH
jgi:hypothetical protein